MIGIGITILCIAIYLTIGVGISELFARSDFVAFGDSGFPEREFKAARDMQFQRETIPYFWAIMILLWVIILMMKVPFKMMGIFVRSLQALLKNDD